MAERKKPLDGIKVVDLTRALSGLIWSQFVADAVNAVITLAIFRRVKLALGGEAAQKL